MFIQTRREHKLKIIVFPYEKNKKNAPGGVEPGLGFQQ